MRTCVTVSMDIGKRIEEVRERAGISQNKLAARMGERNAATVRNWIHGRTSPTWRDIQDIARALKVDMSELTNEDEPTQEDAAE